MNLGKLLNSLNKNDFDSFKIEFLKEKLSNNEKQELLVEIFENHYDHKYFSFYKMVFDLIIEGRLNLNFEIVNNYATHFLSLVTHKAPHIELFEYFIYNGAKINFFNKTNELEDSETCLDFIGTIVEEAIIDDLEGYYCQVKSDYSTIHNNKVCIDKEDYEQLISQSAHLFNLRKTTILRNHIIAVGGKKYCELE